MRVLNYLLPGSRIRVHPEVFNDKTLLEINPPDFKFCLGKLTNKMFPISCKVTFPFFFFFFVQSNENSFKINIITLHHMGEIFNIRFSKIRFGIWRVAFLHF